MIEIQERRANPEEGEPIVRLRDVVKTYNDNGLKVTAIHGISLDIPAQRFSMIIGPSGSGKTTLLNLIGCIDTPTSGSVEIGNQPVAHLNDNALADFRARHVGFIFQTFNLMPVLSAFENVEYPLLLLRVPPRERRERTMAMLESIGLADKAQHRPNQLSGGQKQRIAIARALINGPAIVLADEPTANLDSLTGAAIIELMHEVQRRHGGTFIFSTHDPQLISNAEQIFAIRDGVLVSRAKEPAG
jgi:putative ABC transport system ATP-binding protein